MLGVPSLIARKQAAQFACSNVTALAVRWFRAYPENVEPSLIGRHVANATHI